MLVASRLDDRLESSLARLRAQSYANLTVTVAVPDTAELAGVTARIEAVLPEAAVCAYDPAKGYGTAVNAAVQASRRQGQQDQETEQEQWHMQQSQKQEREQAPEREQQAQTTPSLLLVCSDSVSLPAEAVEQLVERLLNTHAGIVAPKLVEQDNPTRLVSAGFSIDHTAGRIPNATPGELDQGQHDSLEQVFGVASSCFLIRRDLFTALHGFSGQISFLGEDLDLCWRANLATAKVALAPQVVVECDRAGFELVPSGSLAPPAAASRQLSAQPSAQPAANLNKLRWRHRLFSLLTCSSAAKVWLTVPLAALVSSLEAVLALVLGHPRIAADITLAWWWNLARLPQVIRQRRQIAVARYARDSDLRPLLTRGLAELKLFWRSQRLEEGAGMAQLAKGISEWFRGAFTRGSLLLWLVFLVVLGFGSRHLIAQGFPEIGQFSAWPESPRQLFSQWLSSLQAAGLGSDGFNSIALAILGVFSSVLLGAMGLARVLAVLLLIPLGALGVVKLLRKQGSRGVGWVGATVYLCLPLPYNAIANGSWDALVLYGTLPWIVSVLLADIDLGASARSTPRHSDSHLHKLPQLLPRPVTLTNPVLWRHVALLGLLTAAVTAFVPAALALVVLCVVALALGSEFLGVRNAWLLLVGLLGSLVGLLLSLPQLLASGWLSLLRSSSLDSSSSEIFSLWELLRLATGPINNAALGWGLVLVAALPLLVVRDMRFVWVMRGWTLVSFSVALAWLGERNQELAPSADVLLAPAGVGFAIAAAMGVAALAADLPSYRFGWRQLVPLAGAVGLALMIVPVLVGSFDGRWNMPKHDHATPLESLSDSNYRVLWLGHPDVLSGLSHELTDDTYYAMTRGVSHQVAERWAYSPYDQPLKDAVALVRNGDTSRLGRMLAPMGIRYLVVVETLAPPPAESRYQAAEPWVKHLLRQQLDLRQVDSREGILAYENISSQPVALGVTSGSLNGTKSFRDAVSVPFISTSAGLGCDPAAVAKALGCEADRGSSEGLLPANSDVYLASGSGNWKVEINSQQAPEAEAFGWAQVFSGGEAAESLVDARHKTPFGYRVVLVGQLVLWLACLAAALGLRAKPALQGRGMATQGHGMAPQEGAV